MISYIGRTGSSTNQFTRMRMESNHAPMIFQQLRLTIQRGLAYRLYSLYSQIKATKSKLEVCRITLLTHHTFNHGISARG
jgi:hypothetical protein